MLQQYAWYSGNSQSNLWPVGLKLPNRYGAFDMHGNAWEWCHGLYSRPVDQADIAVKSEDYRVLRGGSILYPKVLVRSFHRANLDPAKRSEDIGFRLARTYHLSR